MPCLRSLLRFVCFCNWLLARVHFAFVHCTKAITESQGIFNGIWWVWKRGDVLDRRKSNVQGVFRGCRKKVFDRDMVLLVLSYLLEDLFKN